MVQPRNVASRALLALTAAIVCACATRMVPVDEPADSRTTLAIATGDTVRVLTKYGERPTFEVLEITEDGLIGDDHVIAYDDMAFVEKRETSVAPGAMVAVLVLAGGAVAIQSIGPIAPGGAGAP